MFNYDNQPLPKIYKRNNKECYLDNIRQKLIYITPEETVRQKILSFLINELDVPENMILVEEHISHYGVNSNKRADIIIHEYSESGDVVPIAVIECKAPSVRLSDYGINQVFGYCDAICSEYAMLTNGYDTFCFKYQDDKYIPIKELPKYIDMTNRKYEHKEIGELPPRIPFDEIENTLESMFSDFNDDFWNIDVSPYTNKEQAKAAYNLLECLLDTRRKIPVGDYGYFRVIEDYGVRLLSYGNASGGTFWGPYRSLIIDVNGSTEIVSFAVTTYWKGNNTDKAKTCLVVAIDNEKETHHALQLVIDDNMLVSGARCDFHHHGRISIGNLGSGKINELMEFVEKKYPEIIQGKKYYLGTLVNDHLWAMDEPEVINLIVNLISYSLIRDEYRMYKKSKK